jgi:hypothetical protein
MAQDDVTSPCRSVNTNNSLIALILVSNRHVATINAGMASSDQNSARQLDVIMFSYISNL